MVGKFIVKLKFGEERSIARGDHQKVDRALGRSGRPHFGIATPIALWEEKGDRASSQN